VWAVSLLYSPSAGARRLELGRQCALRTSQFECLDRSFSAADFKLRVKDSVVAKEASPSSDILDTLKDFRGSSEEFYAEKLHLLNIISCETPELTYEAPDYVELVPEERDENDESRNEKLRRYVLSDDINADASFDGVCAVAQDTVCTYSGLGLTDVPVYCGEEDLTGTHYCERLESCKWESIVEGRAREVQYCDKDDIAAGRFKDGKICSVDEVTYADEELSEWLKTTIAYFLIAVILGVTVFIVFSLFCVFRCCCNRCGGRFGHAEQKYTFLQKFIPTTIFMLCVLGILIATGLAHEGNGKVDDGLQITFDSLNDLLDNTYCFLESAKIPIQSVLNTVSSASETAISFLDETDWVYTSVDDIVQQLESFESVYVERLEEYAEYTGDFDLAEEIAPVKATLVEDVQGDIIEGLETAFATLRDEMVSQQTEIEDQVNEAVNSIVELQDSLSENCEGESCLKNTLVDAEETVVDTSDIRLAAALALFAISLVLGSMGFIGILAGVAPIRCSKYVTGFTLNFTWLLAPAVSTLSFVVAGATLLFSVVWTDTCGLMEEMTYDFEGFLDPQMAVGLNACFNDTSLLEAYNLEDELDFADQLTDQFAIVSDLDVAEDFSFVRDSMLEVQKTIEKSIDVSAALEVLNDLLEAEGGVCGGYTGIAFELDTIRAPWEQMRNDEYTTWETSQTPTQYARVGTETREEYVGRLLEVRPIGECPDWPAFDESVMEAYEVVVQLLVLREDMTVDFGIFGTTISNEIKTIRGCEENTLCTTAAFRQKTPNRDDSVANVVIDIEDRLEDTKDAFIQLGDDTVGDLINHVDDFYCNMFCGYIRNDYEKVHEGMCVSTLEGFASVSIAVYVLAILLVPFTVCAAILVIRLQGEGKVKVDALETEGEKLDVVGPPLS